MNFINSLKRYLTNWPEDDRFTPFWRSQLDLIKSIPRILFLFVIPFLIAGIIVRLFSSILENYFPLNLLSPLGWAFIFGFTILFSIGRRLEK